MTGRGSVPGVSFCPAGTLLFPVGKRSCKTWDVCYNIGNKSMSFVYTIRRNI